MKRFKRTLSLVLALCMVLLLLPQMQITRAAEVTQRYELDTDGIDAGATYLIVNTASTGTGNALKFYYQSSRNRDFRNQTLTIKKENGVTYIDAGFTNEADCQFQFSAATAGKITHGAYAVNLSESSFVNGNPSNTLTFTNVGGGQYRIHYGSMWSTYYLRYSNSDWARSTSSSSVYLFKLTEYAVGYDVNYDGNGHTSGTLPENALKLSSGETYTVQAPTELRKDIGEDTWLFQCWNTAADGSGTEYAPGETIKVTEDITLYADWYQQTKHTISMVTYLDGVPTDVNKFAGYDRSFYAELEGGDGTLIPLTRRDEGTYSAKVVENGTYLIYALTIDGKYEQVHGHKVVVYNQTGITECLHYSVTYDAAGGVWAEGEEPAVERCHDGETVVAIEQIPTREGYRFIGWQDQDGKFIHPGHPVTEKADRKITVTALWEELIDVTVNVVIDHKAENGGVDVEQTMHNVELLLLREENGVNLPVEERALVTGYSYDPANDTTTYTVVFENMPQGIYRARANKDDYVQSVVLNGNADEDQTVDITLKFTPEYRNLVFDVVVNADNAAEKALMPVAVNVKITYWGHNEADVLGWHIISEQEGDNVPATVLIGENGRGSGSFTIWGRRSGTDIPYEYRVEVTSFVLPDGTVVPASGDQIFYQPVGSGLYEATVSVEGEGRVPSYPAGSDTTLSGAYFSNQQQMGVPTVTVEITPLTVTFDAGAGKVNGQQTIVLENQYRYPALHDYVAVPDAADKQFICWTDANGDPVENLEDQLLPGNVTYIARYSENIVLSGSVAADAVYEQDGKILQINEIDRVKKVWVVLQKRVGDIYNDVDSAVVALTYQNVDGYDHLVGLGNYEFADLPNDGTEYRVQVLALNYNAAYDNDQNHIYTADESVALIDEKEAKAQVNIHLDFAPDAYQQEVRVDVSRIQKDLRPTAAMLRILYRDLGDVHNFNVITQHAESGMKVEIDSYSASGFAVDQVWNWHTNGAPYEYQVEVTTVYGNDVTGAYMKEGTAYTDKVPYTIVYGAANNYLKQNAQGGVALEATLVPKEFPVYMDLNLGKDANTHVLGLEEFMVDDGSGNDRYMYLHTWSYADEFVAYPYREGYVFKGWVSSDTDDVYIKDDGTIHVGYTLDHSVTLTAQWEKLSGTDYSIRYLELNTDKVLHGAQAVTGAALGHMVVAADSALAIEGYVYAGALVNGTYMEKIDNPVMTVSDDPVKNLMVIYYLPDGSDGYTEQLESNLSINKYAVLEDDGTYTITMDTFTKDNPITTRIQQNTPLDIVMVLDQSGSMYTGGALDDLKRSAENFISLIADHGRKNEVDHRIAIVGYGSDQYGGYTSSSYPTAGRDGNQWVNTGVFDSNGDFHIYPVTGFNYTPYTGLMSADGTYYTYADGEYLLLTYHENYRHLITEEEARVEALNGTQVLGYVDGGFVELTRNSSGLWLYGEKLLYSSDEFFTFHTNVWTHRYGMEYRKIHAYGIGADYASVDGHEGVYTRTETREADPQKSIYKDALIPVTVGAYGSGSVTPGLTKATENIGGNGLTYVSYGIEMANSIFEANPVDAQSGRIRIMVVFTDGKPGDGSNFDEAEADKALAYSQITANTYGARVYTLGLYGDDVVAAASDQDFFMNGLSSNYPNAQKMDDVWVGVTYKLAESDYRLHLGGPYYVNANGTYYLLTRKSVYENKVYYTEWGYTNSSGQFVSIYKGPVANGHPVITNNKVGDYLIYRQYGTGYQTAQNSGFYTVVHNPGDLEKYFAGIVEEITTKITTEIILHEDTILRDIMGEGLVLTPGTVVTAYKEKGVYQEGKIVWSGNLEYVASAEIPQNTPAQVSSSEVTTMRYTLQNGTQIVKENVPYIQIYNLDSTNATDPDKSNYHPHAVDITGYNFEDWYISDTHTVGYKMVVTITQIEAKDNVQWGVSTPTNNEQSGLWLPADEYGHRELLLPFQQPTTIFVERAYVLDYGKEFTLSGWYFDDEDGKVATPVHIDCDLTDGMNQFDPKNPNTANAFTGGTGNTNYGNVQLKDGNVTYTPTTMSWGGYDQFYVFGNTWRKTVLAQDANANGNLWNKVTVIPANNIYYEDSFITTEDTAQNGIEGFTFTGAWSVVGTDSGNTETPEQMEAAPNGGVHGWTDSLADEKGYTDGSAHVTGMNGEMGAAAEFTFTGTGVDVYTRTNASSGMVVAVLNRKLQSGGTQFVESTAVDNLAMSGDYYNIPTVSFTNLPYGTYTLRLIATAASTDGGAKRYEYAIDGIRIYNPLGNTSSYQSDAVKDAYGLETNAVFTEVRDVLLDYGDFNTELPDSTDGKMGAVFIDWIKPGQESGSDKPGTGVPTYEVGTFETYGPKNEVYLTAGQAIVLKVDAANTYSIGLKSLTGAAVTANVSGLDRAEPAQIALAHTTDMYYRVTPVNGYIVIQNANTDGAILSITNLRTTNPYGPVAGVGILSVEQQEAVAFVETFAAYMAQRKTEPEEVQPEEEEELIPSAQEQAKANQLLANALFATVRDWLKID